MVAVAVAVSVAACGDRSERKSRTTSDLPPATETSASNTAANSTSTGASAIPLPAPSSTAPGKIIAASDREFVTLAASADMLEVQAGRLALERSKNAKVRSFAQQMIDAHTRTNDGLNQTATAVGATPPADMAPPHAAHLDKLRALSGADFDREYAAQIGIAAHQEAVALFERASREAANADIRGFVEKNLPELRDYLQDGQALAKNVGVPASRLKLANAPPDLSSLSAMIPGSSGASKGDAALPSAPVAK